MTRDDLQGRTQRASVEVKTTTDSLRFIATEWTSRTWWGRVKMLIWSPIYLALVTLFSPVGVYKWTKKRLPATYKNDCQTAQDNPPGNKHRGQE